MLPAMLPIEDDAAATRALEGVRLSFRMPEELHRRLKMEACRRSGRSMEWSRAGWVPNLTPVAWRGNGVRRGRRERCHRAPSPLLLQVGGHGLLSAL